MPAARFPSTAASRFADSGAAPLSDSAAIASGIYRPTDYADRHEAVETSSNWSGVPTIAINHPGPTGSARFASAFAGAWVTNSTWHLKVRDDVPEISASLAGWSIAFEIPVHRDAAQFRRQQLLRHPVAEHRRDAGHLDHERLHRRRRSGGAAANPWPSWHAKGAGDFNADCEFDILWQNVDGTPGIWLMDGLSLRAAGPVGINPGPAWQIKGTGDFNVDGKADILWQNTRRHAGNLAAWTALSVLAAVRVGSNPEAELAWSRRRRLQQRRQGRHPVAEQ